MGHYMKAFRFWLQSVFFKTFFRSPESPVATRGWVQNSFTSLLGQDWACKAVVDAFLFFPGIFLSPNNILPALEYFCQRFEIIWEVISASHVSGFLEHDEQWFKHSLRKIWQSSWDSEKVETRLLMYLFHGDKKNWGMLKKFRMVEWVGSGADKLQEPIRNCFPIYSFQALNNAGLTSLFRGSRCSLERAGGWEGSPYPSGNEKYVGVWLPSPWLPTLYKLVQIANQISHITSKATSSQSSEMQ